MGLMNQLAPVVYQHCVDVCVCVWLCESVLGDWLFGLTYQLKHYCKLLYYFLVVVCRLCLFKSNWLFVFQH